MGFYWLEQKKEEKKKKIESLRTLTTNYIDCRVVFLGGLVGWLVGR